MDRLTDPLIVAEISCNHSGSLDRALELVDAAAESGADAVKVQTWTPGSMVADRSYGIESGPWAGRNLAGLYDEAQTPWEWHGDVFSRCRERGVIGFASVFDLGALAFLESLDCPMYKIASFEIVDLELIEAVAKTGKPLIISTGMARFAEISDAVAIARRAGCEKLTLLKCTSAYPAQVKICNLATIEHMAEVFACDAGLSDHTLGAAVPVAATILGATVIEKHFTLSRSEGLDAAFSLEPSEFKQMVEACRHAKEAIGKISYGPSLAESSSVALRRSLYSSREIKSGERFTSENVCCVRPALGLHPSKLKDVLQYVASSDVPALTPLSTGMMR